MAAPNSKCYRYSISELQDIETRITTQFDLSKLSFSAVRAGIVPSLSDRVMGPRESAVNIRSRGWSQQTSSASDDQKEYPIRQPKNAPTEPAVQEKEGFAQFLKTHSSPNNNRVTAGGRIVPMETRLAPPRFALPASRANQNTGSAQRTLEPVSTPVRADTAQRANYCNDGPSSNKKNVRYHKATNNAPIPPVVHGIMPTHDSILGPQQAALESSIMLQPQVPSYGQGLGNATLYPAMPGMMSQTPIFVQQYPVNHPYLPFATPFFQPMVTTHGPSLAHGTVLTQLSVNQARLSEANNNYAKCQQQMHDLNRYLATHRGSDKFRMQREQISADRYAWREEIRRLKAAISGQKRAARQHQSVQQQTVGGPPLQSKGPNPTTDETPKAKPASKLNTPSTDETLKAKPANKLNTPSTDETPKAKPASKLNVAAPVFLPRAANPPMASEQGLANLSAAQYSNTKSSTGSPKRKDVDEWNNRLGDPPPQLLREQSLLAEQLLSQLNTPKASDDGGSETNSALSRRFVDSDSPISSQHRAHPAIEAEYGRLLDAMRKPEGTETSVIMSDGRVQLVPGKDLEPPPIKEMSAFEKIYWKRTPFNPDYLGHGDKENSRAPSFTAKTSTQSFESSVLSQDQAKAYRGPLHNSPSRQALCELSTTIAHVPKSHVTHSRDGEGDAAQRGLQAQAANKGSNADGCNKGIVPEPFAKSLGQESLLNKTYSSTALQDIHATASLPRSLDGAVEANLLRVKKGSTPENKSPKSPKSPRSSFFQGFRRPYYSRN